MERQEQEELRIGVRGQIALALMYMGKGIAYVLAFLSGTGLLIATVVLAIKGTISVGAAIGISIVGVPLVGTVACWIAQLIGLALYGIARVLDRDTTSQWIDYEWGESQWAE